MSRLEYEGQRSPKEVVNAFLQKIRTAALAGFPGAILLSLGIYSLASPGAALHPVLGDRNVAISLTVAGGMTLIWAFFRVAMSSRALIRRARAMRDAAADEER
ncbi:MAG: hypothetical protein AAGM16_12595 [Pseudomonadota bacterium]